MPLDRAQFRDLFEAEHVRVHRLLWRLAGNATDADDLLQETFLSAWRHREAYDGRGSAPGWLLKTAVRTYLNHRRGENRRIARNGRAAAPPASPGAERVEAGDAQRFLLDQVRAALHDLPEEPRAAFVMFRLEGLRVAEIADLTDTPVKTIETRIRRAALLLAARLPSLRRHLPQAQP
jgi:RNA polymerase sigma factor (sigma-70 family)